MFFDILLSRYVWLIRRKSTHKNNLISLYILVFSVSLMFLRAIDMHIPRNPSMIFRDGNACE